MLTLGVEEGYRFGNKANCGLPYYNKKKGNYWNMDENIGEFQKL